MSDGLHGHGADFSIGGTTIGNIIRISGPSFSRDPIDISTMDSTNKLREFIPGMIDAGEVTFDLNFEGAATGGSKILLDQITATAAQAMQVILDDAGGTTTQKSTWACNGFITGLGVEVPFDDKVVQSVTVKLTGEPTFTEHS